MQNANRRRNLESNVGVQPRIGKTRKELKGNPIWLSHFENSGEWVSYV
jgi:hypothetical protein